MRQAAIVLCCLGLLAGSVSAQVNRAPLPLYELTQAAEECDCTGACPKSSTPGSLRRTPPPTFSISTADFSEALGVDLSTSLADPSVALEGTSLQFSLEEPKRPAVVGGDGKVKTFLRPDQLVSGLDETDWFKDLPEVASLLGPAGIFRVTEPGLRRGAFPVPGLPKEQELCRIAVRTSNSPTTTACREAINALCPRGVADQSCSLLALRADVNRRNVARIAALVKYDQACLRSDLPQTSPDSVDFRLIAQRTGALRLDLAKASGDCKAAGERLSEGAAFCSAVAIAPDKIMTARHCLVAKTKDWSDIGSCLNQSAVLFATLADPANAVQVRPQPDPQPVFARTKPEDDYVVLALSHPLPGVQGETRRAKAGAFTPAVIISHHELANPDASIGGPAWRQRVRWSKPQCSFTQIAGACGVTNCQTIEGYSGAPVWIRDETGLTALAGLQVGGGGSDLRTCVPPNTLATVPISANLAIWGYQDDPTQ